MKRFYRHIVSDRLTNFEVSYKETDLFISACEDMRFEIFEYVRHLRIELEQYIEKNREFLTSLVPVHFDKKAPEIARDMMRSAQLSDVGPMACVAGAFAKYIGNFILKRCRECVVENGGDIFLKTKKPPIVGIYTNNKHFKDKLKIKLEKSEKPYGICSSSAKIGPSLSRGRADLSLIVSDDSVLSDGLATKTANMIKEKNDIKKAIEFAKSKNIIGCMFIKDDAMGIWGEISLV